MQRAESIQKQFDLSKYLNLDGQIRWVIVNQEYLRGTISNEELIEIYRKWRDQDEYAVFCEFLPDFKLRYHAMKCAKRGNDVYNWRIRKKFRELDELGNLYGDNKIFDINLPNPKTHCLFLTLTYDTKLDDRDTAWKKISIDYNRAVSRLRRKYGKISILRVWEASKKGYPHIHAILLFHDSKFNVFEHWSGHHSSYRIKEKQEFADVWHSNVDVRAVDSIKGAVRYVSKYLRKVHQGDSEHDWTMANMWIHHKQSFALSGDFIQQIAKIRLDFSAMRNSNQKMIQINLEGNPRGNQCVLVGFFTLEQIRQTNILKRPDAWFFMFKKYPAETLCSPNTDLYKPLCRNQTILGSDIFSRSPMSEQEKMGRAISQIHSTNMNLGQICLLRYNLRDSFVPKNKYSGVLFSNNMVLPFVDEDKPKCYLCHEGFENIDKLKKHQQSVHKEFFEFHEKNVKREPAPGDVTVF